jgi:hypothetical protein
LKEYSPIQVMDASHILEVPTPEDMLHLMSNLGDRDNIDVLRFKICVDKCEEKYGPIDYYDEALFASALEWKWFCGDLERKGYI